MILHVPWTRAKVQKNSVPSVLTNCTFCNMAAHPTNCPLRMEICGLNHSNNGRSCEEYLICGAQVVPGVKVKFCNTSITSTYHRVQKKIYNNLGDGAAEPALAVVAIDTGCTVGFCLKILQYRWSGLEGEVATIINVHGKSSNSSIRARSHRPGGMATCAMREGFIWPIPAPGTVLVPELPDIEPVTSPPAPKRVKIRSQSSATAC
jgi:hypothetical protein